MTMTSSDTHTKEQPTSQQLINTMIAGGLGGSIGKYIDNMYIYKCRYVYIPKYIRTHLYIYR